MEMKVDIVEFVENDMVELKKLKVLRHNQVLAQ